ncbi:MAG: hypothetical protein M0Z43_05990 [Acidithiobacillus sp.]|nr:hypothetical protein [Acidithiobacillus sp.]
MQKKQPHRTTITLQPGVLEEVDRRGYYGEGNRGAVINRDLGRLYEEYRHALREIELSPAEGCLILDALNGAFEMRPDTLWAQISDSISLDHTDEKWEVEAGQALVRRLHDMTRTQQLAIVDMAERFWTQGVYDDTSIDAREWVAAQVG